MSDEVTISDHAWREMVRHADEAWPAECCGLLIGRPREVVSAQRAKNAAPEPRRRFLIDPRDHFAAVRAARESGQAVVGAYHSHPGGEPQPSPTDLAEAFDDPTFLHVIVVAPRGREPVVAAYRLITGNFVELRLVRVS